MKYKEYKQRKKAENRVYTTQETLLRSKLRKLFGESYKFDVNDVLSVCPYTIAELRNPCRERDRVIWRHFITTWLIMDGRTYIEAGDFVARDHATAIHGARSLLEQLTLSFERGIKCLYMEVLDMVEGSEFFRINQTDDICVNEAIALSYLDNQIGKMLNENVV